MIIILIQTPRGLLSELKEIINAKDLKYYPEYGKCLINISYCYFDESGIDGIKIISLEPE